MIIPHILNNLKKYGISPSTVEQRQLLLKQNMQLVKEINEMKSRLDYSSYAAANNLYKQIIKFDNVMLFKKLLKEQYKNQENNFENFDNDLWYDDDNQNVKNIAFFRQIIFNKKIRNIIKHIVLKKFISNINYVNYEELLREYINYLENIVFPDAREAMRCVYIQRFLAELQDYIDLTRNLHGGGRSNINKNNILIGGTKDLNSLLTLFTSCALEFQDPKVTALSKICMEPLDRFHAPRIANLIDETLKDSTMINPALVAAYIVEPNEENKKLVELTRIKDLSPERTLNLKTNVLNAKINVNKEEGAEQILAIYKEYHCDLEFDKSEVEKTYTEKAAEAELNKKVTEKAEQDRLQAKLDKITEERNRFREERNKFRDEVGLLLEEKEKEAERLSDEIDKFTGSKLQAIFMKIFIDSIIKKGDFVYFKKSWKWKLYCGVFLLIDNKLFNIVEAVKIDDKYVYTLPNGDNVEIENIDQVNLIDALQVDKNFIRIKNGKKNIYYQKTGSKTKCSLGIKYPIINEVDGGWAYFIHGDENAIGYLPNKSSEKIRDKQLDDKFQLKGIFGKAWLDVSSKIRSAIKYDRDNFSKKYANNEQHEEETVEDGTYKHEYFHDDTEGIIKKYLKYKNKYLEIR
jgi:hypothetical protein